jgi:hypothetical protein
MVDYKTKIEDLLKEHMTEKGFKLWKGINTIIPDIWDKPTSSTGKHHKKMNGDVPTCAEHTYHLLYATSKVMRMFNYFSNTPDGDKMLLACALHDALKYGSLGTRKHTDNKHDKEAADMIASNKNTFLKVMNEDQFYTLEESVRFHSGQWSTDVPKNETFSFSNYNPETLFLHMLDMMSTADLIQTDERD